MGDGEGHTKLELSWADSGIFTEQLHCNRALEEMQFWVSRGSLFALLSGAQKKLDKDEWFVSMSRSHGRHCCL